jgi:hypothetical protein
MFYQKINLNPKTKPFNLFSESRAEVNIACSDVEEKKKEEKP